MELSKRKKHSRLGNLLFVLPIAVVAVAIGVALYQTTLPRTGTLIVEAQGVDTQVVQLHVEVTVDGKVGDTPFNVSLPDGHYTVNFPKTAYYKTPASETVTLPVDVTAYAVGRYVPVPVVILIVDGRFNDTKPEALHGVTPVVWVNNMGSIVVLTGSAFAQQNKVSLVPGQNFTYIFPSAGTFSFQLYDINASGSVDVV